MKFIKIQNSYINLYQVTDIFVDGVTKRIVFAFNGDLDMKFDYELESEFAEALRSLERNGVPL